MALATEFLLTRAPCLLSAKACAVHVALCVDGGSPEFLEGRGQRQQSVGREAWGSWDLP